MPKRVSTGNPPTTGVRFSSHGDASYAQRMRLTTNRLRELRLRALAHGPMAAALKDALDELDHAHEELRAAQDELYERADQLLTARLEQELQWMRYRDLFESAPIAYLETDLDGGVIEANRRCLELLGTSSDSIVGKPLAVFVALPDRLQLRTALTTLRERRDAATLRLQLNPRPPHAAVWANIEVACSTDLHGKLGALRWIIGTAPASSAGPHSDSPSDLVRAPRLADIVPRAPLPTNNAGPGAPRARRSTRGRPAK